MTSIWKAKHQLVEIYQYVHLTLHLPPSPSFSKLLTYSLISRKSCMLWLYKNLNVPLSLGAVGGTLAKVPFTTTVKAGFHGFVSQLWHTRSGHNTCLQGWPSMVFLSTFLHPAMCFCVCCMHACWCMGTLLLSGHHVIFVFSHLH